MTIGGFAYLLMVIAGMTAFAVTLAWVSRRPREKPDSRSAAWNSEFNSSPTSLPHRS